MLEPGTVAKGASLLDVLEDWADLLTPDEQRQYIKQVMREACFEASPRRWRELWNEYQDIRKGRQ